MTRTVVASVNDMLNTLKHSVPGDTVALKSGVVFSSISNYRTPLGPVGAPKDSVIVTSEDPGKKTKVSDFFWQAPLNGITFRDLDLDASAHPQRQSTAFVIGSGCVNTGIDRCSVHGILDGDPLAALKQLGIGGVLIRSSKDCFVTRSEIQRVGVGIGHLDNDGLTIRGNIIHDVRADAIDGGGCSRVLIDSNTIHDWWSYTDDFSGFVAHPDAIQFWTTNTKAPCHDIVITKNKIYRGAGNQAQGVFMGNEQHLRYQRVKIEGNNIQGGIWHGITIYEADHVSIQNNVVGLGPVFKDPRLPATTQVITANWIMAQDVTDLTCLQNWSDEFSLIRAGVTSYGRNGRNSAGQVGK